MKNLIYIIVSIILIATCYSCHEEATDENSFRGFYIIESMRATEAVDLNGDLVKSQNLKLEINNYFNEQDYDLEIRPNFTNDNNAKLISLLLPEPYLSFEYPSYPNGFVEYAKNGIGFNYEFRDNLFILNETSNDFVTIDKIELLDYAKIKSIISKDYYDFERQDWVNLNIEIIYSKME